jgi:hypothetical protein
MHDLLLRAGMELHRVRYWRPLERMAHRPDAAQQQLLRSLLFANRHTRFGIEHGFDGIANASEFRDRVPVQDYETLRPYINDQRRTGAQALTAESPVFYAQTSGSTGTPKYIPITPSGLEMHRAEQALFSYLQFRACPQAFAGKALGVMGAAVEGHLDTGHAVGSVSGHLYQSLPRSVLSRLVVPPAVASIAAYELKYLVILRLALAQPRVTYMGTPNPSTFLRLLDILNARRDLLLQSLHTGKLDGFDGLDGAAREVVAARLKADPARAASLRNAASLTFANVWPGIRLVTTWTGGSCGIALDALRRKLPPEATVMELGYQSSEFRGTIALDAETPHGLPPLHHHFFEFVEQAKWDSGNAAFLTLDQLEAGRRYYILITTASGLYRYFMNDLVEVSGFFHRTPLLRFIQKGKGVTSLTGEKLYEGQAIDAVLASTGKYGVSSSFFLLVADEKISAYQLLVESDDGGRADTQGFVAAVDRRLGELNIEYHGKRMSGRLGPLTISWLKRGAADAYKSACIRAGQREGQFKPAVLQYRKDLILSFDDFLISPVATHV